MVDQDVGGSGAFGRHLRGMRERAGLTQQELAGGSGLSAAAIRDLEQGRSRRPRPRSVRALAEALELSPADTESLHEAVRETRPTVVVPPDDDHAEPVRVAVFGPLALYRGARAVPLGAGRHRVILGRLALTPNTGVTRDELVDLLWGDDVPPSAVNLVQTYVSRLRRVLETGSRRGRRPDILALVTGGYRLNLVTEQLDLLMGRELMGRVRALGNDPAAAFALLDDLLRHWPDAPLKDVPELRGEPTLTAIEEERVAAAIHHSRLAEVLGRSDRALPRLRELARHHPLHEPLQAQLVTTLARAGQQAAALGAYEEIRRRLVEELGISPGPELTEAFRSVLGPAGGRTSVAAPPGRSSVSPWQVPAPPADFTGRADELRRLGRLVGRDPERPSPESVTVCAVSGVAGVGKTALVLRTAQLLRPSFPDGQLYVDLQGFGPLPVPPLDALAGFLRALGIPGRLVPREEAECAALFRSVLADRRVLVVLDNARDAAQVRPLLPGTGGSAVLVTSRRRLVDLVGAVVVDLALPSAAEAMELLAASAGPARVAAEPDAAADLALACGRLPIALRVAGARLASRPGWTVRAAAERLADQRHRLDRLRIGDLAVEASFDLSYRELSAAAARAFRLLAVLPGIDFGLAAGARVLAGDEPAVEAVLQELADHNLLQVCAEGRYRYHDLLRIYAARRGEVEDAPVDRSAALSRLLDWYVECTAAAMRLVYPGMVRLPTPIGGDTTFADEAAALGWLDSELTGLTAAVQMAADAGVPARAWQLADQLRGYFFVRRQAVPWLATGRAGLDAAERMGDPVARAAMHQTIGQAYWSVGQHDSALAEYDRAATLAEEGGWSVGLAYQWHNIGLVRAELGHLDDAQAAYERALAVAQGPDFDHVRAVTLNDLGTLCHERGLLTDAAAHFTAALAINQGVSRLQSAMANRANLGMVLRQLGEHEAARVNLETALAHYRRTGSPKGELSILDELSQLYTQCDQAEAAVAAASRGLELTRTLGDRRSEAALLGTLGAALFGAGAVADAEGCFQASLELAGELGSPSFQVQAHIGLSRVRLIGGAVEQAMLAATEALRTARRVGYRILEGEALLALAQAYVAAGRDEEAARCCGEAAAVNQALNLSPELRQVIAMSRQPAPAGPAAKGPTGAARRGELAAPVAVGGGRIG